MTNTSKRPWMKAADMLLGCAFAALIVGILLKNVVVLALAMLVGLLTLVLTVLAYAWIGYKHSTNPSDGASTSPRE